jgi:hypothetical protein
VLPGWHHHFHGLLLRVVGYFTRAGDFVRNPVIQGIWNRSLVLCQFQELQKKAQGEYLRFNLIKAWMIST